MADRRKKLMRVALWTEILEALRKDFPGVEFDDTAGPEMTKVVRANADHIADRTSGVVVDRQALLDAVRALDKLRDLFSDDEISSGEVTTHGKAG